MSPKPKSKSVLPTVERVPAGGGPKIKELNLGVPIEPFKNWPLDVKLVTHDPFRVEGNLAQSAVVIDLHVGGNLGVPVPNGEVAIDKGKLTLPFSKVNVEIGKVSFNEKTGFNGTVELKARAKTGDYRVSIFAFNRALDPKVVFTSVPPLPREEILTLLATGTTRDEFTGSDGGSVAASKAAMLLFKKMQKTKVAGDDEHTLLDELQERTELELGRVNPETGEQTFGGKIRLWKQLFFVGDVDSESDYRALLKYVFRFR